MRGFSFLIFLTLTFSSWSQSDSIQAPTDSVKPHSVKKATILSAVVPGAGQIYNHLAMPKGKKKAFWKVPLIYAGLGSMTYFLVSNQIVVRDLKTEYTSRQNTGIVTNFPQYDNSGLLTLYDQYSRWRDFSIIGLGAFYAFQVADAAVEAHFVSFDVSEDLSMKIHPTMMSFTTPGIRLSLNFH